MVTPIKAAWRFKRVIAGFFSEKTNSVQVLSDISGFEDREFIFLVRAPVALLRRRRLHHLHVYCVERKEGPEKWVQEIRFKTEFKAFINARSKSLATLKTYRIMQRSPGDSVEVLRVSKGKTL